MSNFKTNRKSQLQRILSTDDKCLSVQEKWIDIPVIDNKEKRMDLIARIEAVSLKIIEQISTGWSPRITYHSARNVNKRFPLREENVYSGCLSNSQIEFLDDSLSDFIKDEDKQENIDKNPERITVDFGIKRSRDKFVLMMTIMAEAHHLLLTNTTKTRRAFYYDLKNQTTENLVPEQAYIDRALNDVANLLECVPWELRLLATAKGLVAGNMTITLANNEIIDCMTPGGALIPQIISNVASIRTKAKFVLIVEKDAAFQKLLDENCSRILNCILVTGKGYPDVATRMLVKLLSEKMELPVYIIVDADPFGIDIMLIYRFGSMSFYKGNESLVCPKVRWLGILPSELIVLGAKIIPLTEIDLAKLRAIEARPYVSEALSRQLKILRKGKAEIEAVSSFSKNFLTATYLPYKIDGHDYI